MLRVGALWSCESLDYNFRACGAGTPNKSTPRFVHTRAKSEPETAILRRNSSYVWDNRHLGYVWTFCLVGLDLQANALMRTKNMVARSSHSHIQGHGNENYRRITSRSIVTPASLLTVTGNTEKIATDIHKNAHWQHMRTTRNGPSNLLGKE